MLLDFFSKLEFYVNLSDKQLFSSTVDDIFHNEWLNITRICRNVNLNAQAVSVKICKYMAHGNLLETKKNKIIQH